MDSKVTSLELSLIRRHDTKKQTLGELRIDGQLECFTLEDTFRHVKVMNETRIPEGRYEIKPRKVGSMVKRYKEMYGKEHYMLHLQNVHNFTFVYIHPGNTEEDTSGCILLGQHIDYSILPIKLGVQTLRQVRAKTISSRNAYKKVFDKVHKALTKGRVFITIIDN